MNSIHKQTHFYSPSTYLEASLPEVTIVFNTLSYGELNTLNTIYADGKTSEYSYRVCELAMIKIESINQETLSLSELPSLIIRDISAEIIKHSSISQEFHDKLNESADLYFSETLSADTWKCDICIKKRLQGSRNCPLIGEEEKNDGFKLMVNNSLYTHCPIPSIDLSLVSIGIEAYNIYKSGFLPSIGGWYDQTQTFCISSIVINNKIEERNKVQMEKHIQESKRNS